MELTSVSSLPTASLFSSLSFDTTESVGVATPLFEVTQTAAQSSPLLLSSNVSLTGYQPHYYINFEIAVSKLSCLIFLISNLYIFPLSSKLTHQVGPCIFPILVYSLSTELAPSLHAAFSVLLLPSQELHAVIRPFHVDV